MKKSDQFQNKHACNFFVYSNCHLKFFFLLCPRKMQHILNYNQHLQDNYMVHAYVGTDHHFYYKFA